MAINSAIHRTTGLMSSDMLGRSLQQTQRELLDANQKISTGKSFDRASDEPSKVSAVMWLEEQIQERAQQTRNMNHAAGLLDSADQSLGDVTDTLNEAKSIASSQIGVGSNADTRRSQAGVIDGQIKGLLDVANRQYNDISLFGGNNGAGPSGQIFESFMGGVRYTGGGENLRGDLGALSTESINSNGIDAFGALSSRVKSQANLDPQATPQTRLADLTGAQGHGVRTGSVEVVVGGDASVVDLSSADTMADVVTRLNDTLGGDGSVAVNNQGFTVNSNGPAIELRDPMDGETAGDLGLRLAAPAGGSATGADVNPKLTETTQLADLAVGIDFASGFTIEQGTERFTIDTSSAETVEDLQNLTKNEGIGVRLQINADGDAMDLVSEVAGLEMSVGENGGSTAADLGIRSFDGSTRLDDFRHGRGVEALEGEDDLAFSLRGGAEFTVNLDGLSTAGEVVTRIEEQAADAGVAVGSDFRVGFAETGNGLSFTDNTAATGSLVIDNAGLSHAASHLGINGSSNGGDTIAGEDNAKVQVDNVFTHLMNLSDSLLGNDTAGITIAGSSLEDDLDQVISARSMVGVQAKRIDDHQQRTQDQELQEQTMLSQLQDANMTEVITRFRQLQTQLQASMRTGAQTQQQSLLDFLR